MLFPDERRVSLLCCLTLDGQGPSNARLRHGMCIWIEAGGEAAAGMQKPPASTSFSKAC